jgi:predicted kinase
MKELFLLRGLPGAGKSTLAKSIGENHIEADMYFTDLVGEYEFDASKLKEAHAWCQNAVRIWMINQVPKVVVSNTFTQTWEMDYYFELAKEHGYRAYSLVVENRHGGENIHNVPKEKIEEMARRFNVKIL